MGEHQYKGRTPGKRPHSRQNGRRPGQGHYGKDRQFGKRRFNRKDAKKPLSFWQKILQFFGIGKKSKNSKKELSKAPSKVNVRDTRGTQNFQKKAPKKPVNVPRLYVGNLSYEATESDIEDLFKGIGSVNTVEIIYNPRTHKSKGYGFVEMRLMEDAHRAVEVLHDQPFMGRNLTVSAANERDSREEEGDNTPTSITVDNVGEIQETVEPLV